MYNVLQILLGDNNAHTLIVNEEQISDVVEFVKNAEGNDVDILETVESKFDARVVTPVIVDPFGYDYQPLDLKDDYESEEERQFYISVQLKFDHSISACSKKQAIEIVRDNFHQEHGIVLENHEIVYVEEEE